MAESVVATGVGLTQDDSALKIASRLHELLVMRSGALPRWLGWFVIVAGILFFLQGFGLGGVIASFGLVLDLIAFVLFLIFILVSSVILLRRQPAAAGQASPPG